MKRCVLRQQHILAPCVCCCWLVLFKRKEKKKGLSLPAINHPVYFLCVLNRNCTLGAALGKKTNENWLAKGQREAKILCVHHWFPGKWSLVDFSWRRFAMVSFSFKSSAFILKLKMERCEIVDTSKAEHSFSALALIIIYIGCIAHQ